MLDFFTTSTRNLLAAEKDAGVGPPRRAVGRRNRAPGRERLLPREDRPGEAHQRIGIPYSIVHATQFFEFVKSIAQAATEGDTVRLSPALIQPMAAEDVAAAVGRDAVGSRSTARGGRRARAFGLDELIRKGLASAAIRARSSPTRPRATSTRCSSERELLPGRDAGLFETRFEDWLNQQ